MALRFLVRWSVALAAIVLIVSGVAVAQTPRRGGVLRVGNLGEPPALDAHWTTASITETLTNHIYEGLYSLDATNRPIPMLAESHSVSRDGLTYTFKLRQAVKFHNGKEMTAEDVVPSLARWGKQSIYGKALFAQVADWRAVDRYTVEMRLKEKSAIVLISLAVPNNFGAIYPREIVEKFPPEVKVTEYVGTGPFKLAEWKPDQYIRMVRFDDYKPRNEVLPDGLEPNPRRDRRLAHEARRAPLERAQPGEGQAAPEGGRLQERAGPLHDDAGVQVDVRLRAADEAAARGCRVHHRPPGRGLGDARETAEQPEGVRRVHDRHGRLLRPDPPHLPHGDLAGLDHRRGHSESAGRARARDGSEEAHGVVGATNPAVLREGARHPIRQPVRPPPDADLAERLQRADRAHPLLQRVARQVR